MTEPTEQKTEQVSSIPATPGNEHSVESVAQNLFESLASDPEFAQDETTERPNESPGDPDPEAGEFEEEEFEEFDEDFEDDDFADEDEYEEVDEDESEQPTFAVTVDGEEMEVTLDELISGYSRHSDYTRKTQELAEQRKQIRQEAEQTAKARQQYGELIGELAGVLEAQNPDNVDWERLRRENPQEYAVKYAEHSQRQQEINALRQEQARVMQAQAKELLQAEQEQLLNAVPEWQENPETMQEELENLYEVAQKQYGFSDEELGAVADHRALLILRDAARYRELASKGDKVKRKKKGTKTLEPGSRVSQKGKRRRQSRKKVEAARERLRKTGRKEDAARLFMDMDLD